MDTTIEQEMIEQFRKLSDEKQKGLLSLVKTMNRPKGTPGKEFIEMTRSLSISHEDLETMRRVIEEDLERIELDDWDLPS